MNDLIQQYKQHKIRVEFAESVIVETFAALEQTSEWQRWQQVKEQAAITQSEFKEIEDKLRQAAIDNYLTTGDKKPFAGVSIVLNKVLDYLPDRAMRWAASNNALNMLTLNKREFEKHARAVLDTVPLEFVSVEEIPSVRLSKEL